MNFEIQAQTSALATLRVQGRLRNANSLAPLHRMLCSLSKEGVVGVLLNCSELQKVTSAGLAGFIDFMLSDLDLAVVAYATHALLRERLTALHLADVLPIYDSHSSALASPIITKLALTYVPCVVLHSQPDPALAPLTSHTPLPLLDVAGKPLLQRRLDHLDRYGCGQVFIHSACKRREVAEFCSGLYRPSQSILNLADQFNDPSEHVHERDSQLDALHQLNALGAIGRKAVLLTSGGQIDTACLDALLRTHEEHAADVTLLTRPAMNPGASYTPRFFARADGRLAANGDGFGAGDGLTPLTYLETCVISPSVVEAMLGGALPGGDVNALIDNAQRLGFACMTHVSRAASISIDRPVDYFRAQEAALTGQMTDVVPTGEQINPHVWVDDCVKLSRGVKFQGPCHIGRGSIIERRVSIKGPSVIGHGSYIAKHASLTRAIVLPNTQLNMDSQITDQTLGNTVSVPHEEAPALHHSVSARPLLSHPRSQQTASKLTA